MDAIAKKVYVGLVSETKRHCDLQCAANHSRWLSMLEQQAEERRTFFKEAFSAVNTKFDSRQAIKTKGLTLDEAFEREERRLYLDSYANYEKYELFNLSHAFGLQLSRVDAEWGVYEQQMQNDYEAQRATVLGKGKRQRDTKQYKCPR